jgi:hypothetical protein
MGYHKNVINKGRFGHFSKIEEEWEELLDARSQKCRVLEICEFADLYGAIREYILREHNLSMKDLEQMVDLTASAFRDGERK